MGHVERDCPAMTGELNERRSATSRGKLGIRYGKGERNTSSRDEHEIWLQMWWVKDNSQGVFYIKRSIIKSSISFFVLNSLKRVKDGGPFWSWKKFPFKLFADFLGGGQVRFVNLDSTLPVLYKYWHDSPILGLNQAPCRRDNQLSKGLVPRSASISAILNTARN